MFVAVAGNIGAGKSSLTRVLAQHFGLEPIYEAVDENPYLTDFYADMPRYAFHSQMFFLARRLEQHISKVNSGNRVIQDRTVYEDAHIFARNLTDEGVLDARDFRVYTEMYGAICGALRPPDLLVYLRAELPTLQRHIARRGRDFERSIDPDYLARLGTLYENWFRTYDLSPKIVVEADTLDFVNDPEALRVVLAQLGPWLATPILSAHLSDQ